MDMVAHTVPCEVPGDVMSWSWDKYFKVMSWPWDKYFKVISWPWDKNFKVMNSPWGTKFKVMSNPGPGGALVPDQIESDISQQYKDLWRCIMVRIKSCTYFQGLLLWDVSSQALSTSEGRMSHNISIPDDIYRTFIGCAQCTQTPPVYFNIITWSLEWAYGLWWQAKTI